MPLDAAYNVPTEAVHSSQLAVPLAAASADPYELHFDDDRFPDDNPEQLSEQIPEDFESLLPGPRAVDAAQDIAQLAMQIGPQDPGCTVPVLILTHQWSKLNCPLMWAATGDCDTHPVLDCLLRVLNAMQAGTASPTNATTISPAQLPTSWQVWREHLRRQGIADRAGLLSWLRSRGEAHVELGGHISRGAQEMLIEQASAFDLRARDISRAYVLASLFLSVRPRVVAHILEQRRPHQPAAPPPVPLPSFARSSRIDGLSGVASLPDGWSALETMILRDELAHPVQTLKSVPQCIRSSFARIQTQALAKIHLTHESLRRTARTRSNLTELEASHTAAWKLFLLLPRMMLFKTACGGEAGEGAAEAAGWGCGG